MLKILRKKAGFFSLVILIYVLNSIVPISLSYTNGRLIDAAYKGEVEIFWIVLLIWSLLFTFRRILRFLFGIFVYVFNKKILTDLQILAFNRLFFLEKGIFSVNFNTSHRIFLTDFEELLPYIYKNINLFFSILRIIIDLSVLIIFNYIFGIGVTLLIIIFLFLPIFFNVRISKIGILQANLGAEQYSRHSNLLDGFDILATSNKSSKLMEINNRIWNSIRKLLYSLWTKNALYSGVTSLVYSVFNIIVIISAFAFVYMGWFSLGSLVFVRSLAVGSLDDSYKIITRFITLFLKKPIVKDYLKLASEAEKLRKKQITNLETLKEININNVSFSYDESTKVIDAFSLKIKQGKKILITGKSGLGKTTISRLLLNYVKPLSGKIFWNETSYSKLNIYDIREKIAYISGNFKIFTGSVRENLVLERKTIQEEKLIEKLSVLNLGGFKLDDTISPDTISSGQNQRFIIARELLAPREIIIFDEAMSNIDPKNRSVIENILLSDPNLTFINITHHLNSRKRYDEVIDLNENRYS